ncbi:hypothetical protein [Metabacillus sp. Hm71]|uniref:hypothetical protein n=1 Tax=Metabacillus sp. Hm71 TaxID=3450743 RepID=UPI003F426EFD
MKKWIVKFFVIFTFILVLVGCSKSQENIDKVNVYEMKSFSSVEKDSLTTFTDSKVVNDFIKAFNNAKREPGIVNMSDPDNKVDLGDETYFLWISEEYGTIMNLNDTNTIYTLSKSSAKTINELLN